MVIKVTYSEDAAWVLDTAKEFLAASPIRHNLILTLLNARTERFMPGRYWLATDRDTVIGVALQSPLDFPITVTPMSVEAVTAVTGAIAEAKVSLPGVNGEAATAACFAGQWTEHCGLAATPCQGQRIYEVTEVEESAVTKHRLRQASANDYELLLNWVEGFHADINEPRDNLSRVVESRLVAGKFWLLADSEPVSMASHSQMIAGVVRMQMVYTPPSKRNRGYARSCVGSLSRHFIAQGYRCMLYTDLSNPVSNSIYRRVGYRAVAEGLRYRFD